MTNVIVAERSEEEAYDMGFERFEAFENTVEDQTGLDLEAFRQGAEYANHVLPDLRALAGFEDAGYGTYQIDGEIVIVDAADLDDDPIDGDSWSAQGYFDVLVDRWHDGARDALDADSEYGDSL